MAIERDGKPRDTFFVILGLYVIVLIFACLNLKWYFNLSEKGDPIIWFYYALAIGSIYVFIAFAYFYEHYLLPYVKDLEKPIAIRRKNIHAWVLGWIFPAVIVQFFVYIGFWMTVQIIPTTVSIYTHPYMYGLSYKKLNGYLSSEVAQAGLTSKLDKESIQNITGIMPQKWEFIVKEFSPLIDLEKAKECLSSPITEPPENDNGQANLAENAELTIITIYKLPFYIALTFSFLGTLMYTLNDISRRFFISDLYSKTYVAYLIRFLLAPALSMVIAYYLMSDWPTNVAPILFFFIGFFPQLAITFVYEKGRSFLGIKPDKKKEVPLGLIQGITDYNLSRLRELGIEDAQNLAEADLNYLRKNWYNMRQLSDFIAQAILLIHLKEHFANLQGAGIRSIVDFKRLFDDEKAMDEYAIKLNLPIAKLKVVKKLIEKSPLKERVALLFRIMRFYSMKEVANADEWVPAE